MANESQILSVTTDGPSGKLPTAKAALVNASGVSIFKSAQFNLGGDVWVYWGAGVPVDYTDGSPPATGEAEASIGSLYIDTTNGDLYRNTGTKAQPAWTAFGDAA